MYQCRHCKSEFTRPKRLWTNFEVCPWCASLNYEEKQEDKIREELNHD